MQVKIGVMVMGGTCGVRKKKWDGSGMANVYQIVYDFTSSRLTEFNSFGVHVKKSYYY